MSFKSRKNQGANIDSRKGSEYRPGFLLLGVIATPVKGNLLAENEAKLRVSQKGRAVSGFVVTV